MEPMTIVLVALAIVAILVCIPHMILRVRGIKSNFETDMLLALASMFFGGIWYIGLICYSCFCSKE